MFTRRRGRATTTADDESVDVAARLHPYEELFNEAMAMAARFSDDGGASRRRTSRAPSPVTVVAAPTHVARRRAS